MKSQKSQRTTKKSHVLRWSGLFAIVIILAGGAIAFAIHSNNKKNVIVTKPSSVTTGGQYTKGEPSTSTSTSPSTGSSSGGGTSTKTTPSGGSSSSSSTTGTLLVPSGGFVSNHRPNLSGSPAPNTEESVCNTTPGATCEIIFTMNDTTKTLPAQATDGNGAAYWNWKLQDIGLTQGTWQVSAKATLGSQTQTAQDVISFVVGQ